MMTGGATGLTSVHLKKSSPAAAPNFSASSTASEPCTKRRTRASSGVRHPVEGGRTHLYERTGDHDRALDHYRTAAERTMSIPERNYLMTKGARLAAAQRSAEQSRASRAETTRDPASPSDPGRRVTKRSIDPSSGCRFRARPFDQRLNPDVPSHRTRLVHRTRHLHRSHTICRQNQGE